ncbi:hypothetical protein JCM10450v2_004853 [Rhodotorula kratochvilovae]
MPPSNGDAPPTPAFVSEGDYLTALSRFIRTHEAALAAYYAPRPKQKAAPSPSWTTVLTLGIVPTADSASTPPPPPRRNPLVLKFDPHHLYYLLLKFDELAIPGTGELDVAVEGGPTRPMSVDYSAVPGAGSGRAGSLLGGLPGAGMLGFPAKNGDDARSVRSGMSSFSFGSGWWGLGGHKLLPTKEEEATNVRYIYSSCTKLPALKLAPFHLVAAEGTPALACAVEGFADCPPPATCVPLHAFKNLQALVLEDLDPRGFLGWDVLAVQLRSLEVRRGGIEDVGELICDAPCEDLARRTEEERRNRPVGTERRRRAAGLSESSLPCGDEVDRPASPSTAAYPTPPRHAWSSLRHLSLVDNSLTFIPSPPMTFLPTLTSLDLSSNLLISIPPALAHLTSLRSLNLSDNMIDSLLGVAKALGAITALNLSRNRLENLSGLDRLAALERLDVRDNTLGETLEVSRVARLPLLREVYLSGNPFTRPREEGGDDAWRTKSFGYFAEEDAHGHRAASAASVRIDGAGMSGSERRAVEAALARRGTPVGRHRRASAGGADRPAAVSEGQHKVVVGRRVVTAPDRPHHAHSPPPPLPAPSIATETASIASSGATAAQPASPTKPRARRHKPRRIVDLDADASHPPSLASASSAAPPAQGRFDSDQPSSSGAERSSSSHAAAAAAAGVSSEGLSSSPAAAGRSTRSLGPSSARSHARRERLSASSFEPPPLDAGAGGGEALRRRIEALREEVGESWLSVLGEREARERERRDAPVTTSQSAAVEAEGAMGSGKGAHEAREEPRVEGEEAAARAEDASQADAVSPPAPGAATAPPINSARAPAPDEEAEAVAAVPTAVKSVRKKKGKGGKKKGGR